MKPIQLPLPVETALLQAIWDAKPHVCNERRSPAHERVAEALNHLELWITDWRMEPKEVASTQIPKSPHYRQPAPSTWKWAWKMDWCKMNGLPCANNEIWALAEQQWIASNEGPSRAPGDAVTSDVALSSQESVQSAPEANGAQAQPYRVGTPHPSMTPGSAWAAEQLAQGKNPFVTTVPALNPQGPAAPVG